MNQFIIKTYEPSSFEKVVFKMINSIQIGKISYLLKKRISDSVIKRYIRDCYREDFSTDYLISIYKDNLVDLNRLKFSKRETITRKFSQGMRSDPISYMKNFSTSTPLLDEPLSDNLYKRYRHLFNKLIIAEDLRKNDLKNQNPNFIDQKSDFDKMFDEARDHIVDEMVADTYAFQANPKFFVSIIKAIIDELNKKDKKIIYLFTHIIEID